MSRLVVWDGGATKVKSEEWRVERDWNQALSLLLTSAQSVNKCIEVIRRLPVPEILR